MICGPNYPVGPVLNLFLMLSRSTALKAVGLSVDDKPRSAGHFPAFSSSSAFATSAFALLNFPWLW